jgi:hypothetical protein
LKAWFHSPIPLNKYGLRRLAFHSTSVHRGDLLQVENGLTLRMVWFFAERGVQECLAGRFFAATVRLHGYKHSIDLR